MYKIQIFNQLQIRYFKIQSNTVSLIQLHRARTYQFDYHQERGEVNLEKRGRRYIEDPSDSAKEHGIS